MTSKTTKIDVRAVKIAAEFFAQQAEKKAELAQWCWRAFCQENDLEKALQHWEDAQEARQSSLRLRETLEDYLLGQANKAADLAKAAWLEWNATPAEWIEESEAAAERLLLAEEVEMEMDDLVARYLW